MNPIRCNKNAGISFPADSPFNPFQSIPLEIIRVVFISTDSRSLSYINQVSKKWYGLTCDDFVWNKTILAEIQLKGYRERVFTPSDWGIEGNFPKNLCLELDKPSPFYEGKTVGETSLVTFKNPKIQNCKELEDWGKEKGVRKLYKIHTKQIAELEKEHSMSLSEWLLIPSGGVIPNSRKKSLETLKKDLKQKDETYHPASLFDISMVHLTSIFHGHNALYSPSFVFTRCLSTNTAIFQSINIYSNHEKELLAMEFFSDSLVPNTGIIPIKELPYTSRCKALEYREIK